MSGGEVRRATDDREDSSFEELKGKEIQGSDGNKLGDIHDFMIDASSGEIKHVVVSTGGLLGLGDKLRVLPPSSVNQAGDGTFTADMQKSEFEALPVISESDLDAGRIAAHSATQQRSESVSSTEATSTDATASAQPTGQLVRASKLEDKAIRSDNAEIGEVEDIVIDLRAGKAMALVEVDSSFADEEGEYLVPFSKLQVSLQEGDSIGSTLLRSDFARQQASSTAALGSGSSTDYSTTAGTSGTTSTTSPSATATYPSTSSSAVASSSTPTSSSTGDRSRAGTQSASSSDVAGTSTTPQPGDASSVSSTDRSRTSSDVASSTRGASQSASADTANQAGVATPTPLITSDEQLTPTGTSSADQNPASSATAMAIRRALDQDSQLATEEVQVTTKVVLQGSVKDEKARNRIEELAKEAAGDVEIDNQIKVKQD